MGAHPLAGADRGQKTHLVETVVDTHGDVFRDHTLALREPGEHRQGQKAVRDRAAKRGLRGFLPVNVNKLVVLGAIGEGVDAILIEGQPGAGRELRADVIGELLFRYCGHTHRESPAICSVLCCSVVGVLRVSVLVLSHRGRWR